MNAHVALTAVALVAAVGITVDAAEFVRARAVITTSFDWQIIHTVHRWAILQPGERARLGALTDPHPWLIFHVSRSAAAAGAAAAAWADNLAVAGLFAVYLVVAQLVISARLAFGMDGADQMQTMIWVGVTIACLQPAAGLILIAGQSLLSYWVAGIAKLWGKEWRNGEAPRRVLATSTHGAAATSTLAMRSSKALAWATIAFEVGGPVVALTSPVGAVVFVVCAVIFHVSIAFAMGLNNFVWAFCAALAAVVWLSSAVH